MTRRKIRVILYTGKGGVGKTSVSAATALRAARLGYRTLVMSTDSAHSLGDSFDLPVGSEVVQITDNLWAQELDVFKEIDRHWGTLEDYIKIVMAWRGIDEVLAEEMAVLPGMEELAGLVHLINYYEGQEYDTIVVDCAPTGETLRLLSFPDVMRWWLHRIFPIQRTAARIARPVLTRVTDLPFPEDDVFEALKDLFERLDKMRAILTDADVSSVRLVLNAEKMVVKEAQRTFTYLNLYGYPTDLVVCNRLIPDDVTDAYFSSWKESQERYLSLVEEGFSPLPILTAPLMDQEVVGLEMLERFGNALYDNDDPTLVHFRGQTQEMRQEDGDYLLTLLLPFTGKEEVALSQVGDELLVRVGNHRRNVILPRALVGLQTQSAKLEGDRLTIRFVRPD
ncbi:MAG TPA: TRC40/GET3/ArsA family transport-energizing ATPase [Dehalococcoidia bacterium]|nr:TRC40/GET3/ArsA family transport-energizing ATPase [Dehalococcoidia bacterium]